MPLYFCRDLSRRYEIYTFRRYRRVVEILQAVIIISLPFVKIKGQSALRFDIPSLRLYFFGTVIWIKEFYLVLLLIIFFIFLIIFVTAVFGRIWCGWLCPQTVLLDLSSDATRVFPLRLREKIEKLVLIPLSGLVSMSLIWYFVPPHEMVAALFSSKVITGFYVVLWMVIYGELAFLGRRFCTTICPYSMLQSGLFDRDTLVIAFEGSREGCMGCDKCVRVCPVGIDIKKGLRRECVACAECIDACRSMTLPRGIQPFVSYRGRVLRGKTFVLAMGSLAFLLVFLLALYSRPSFDVVVTRDVQQGSSLVNSYSYTITNNRSRPVKIRISVEGGYLILGETLISLGPFAMKRGRLLLRRLSGTTESAPVIVFSSDDFVQKQMAGYL